MFRILLFLMILVTIRTDDEGKPKELDVSEDDPPQTELRSAPSYPGSNVQRCFACTNCDTVFYNTTVYTCPHSQDTGKLKKCVTYIEKYKYLDKPWYIRGCASVRGSCDDIRRTHDQFDDDVMVIASCHECEGDKCNGVSRSLPMAILGFIITPILAKLAI